MTIDAYRYRYISHRIISSPIQSRLPATPLLLSEIQLP